MASILSDKPEIELLDGRAYPKEPEGSPRRRIIAAHDSHGVRNYTTCDSFEHSAVPWLKFDVAVIFAKLALLKG